MLVCEGGGYVLGGHSSRLLLHLFQIIELKSTQENLEKQLAVKQRELEQLTKHLEEMQHKFVSVDHIVELERERDSLKVQAAF